MGKSLTSLKIRFKEKVIDKAEDYVPFGWETWIKPLEVVAFDGKTIILCHKLYPNENVWVNTHYGELISSLLNENVEYKITVEFTSGPTEVIK